MGGIEEAAPSILDRTILSVLVSSACRISEGLGLMVKNLKLYKPVATVARKSGRRERVTMGSQRAEALRISPKACA